MELVPELTTAEKNSLKWLAVLEKFVESDCKILCDCATCNAVAFQMGISE